MSTTFENATTQSVDVNGTKFVFREVGRKGGTPVVLLHHLTAVLEDWDPRIVDGLAGKHHVIAFDNRGVGGSGGSTPKTVEEMARDAATFIAALGFSKVDLLGFSLGGFVAQLIAQQQPGLVRKIVLAGTGPAGGEGIANVGAVLQDAFGKAGATNKHPKQFLFFTQTKNGQAAAEDFLRRLKERTKDLDTPVSNETIQAQIAAIGAWGQGDATALGTVQHPVLVVNGDDDVMVPSFNSFELARRLPNAQLSIFPDAGHGGIFQYHAAFVQQTLAFLEQ
ncbi:alpha/beta fold hydrolase [Bradyrhizobium erythrophlei]|uniref:Pimeloyl-ACP methyl ester carboxylesterase n=1 Tax=Bradyrhizobium erythrophlei TaxID=1437360 RepID=A0A1M7U5T0_9BRAD|nr:alpha/beta hydrolase [Bradyrhizobium erythrophlei]SHN78389.1 Pimeloyl-ACP methyl ester carboxylesterase [Bradyrhizobium erythrophlei]